MDTVEKTTLGVIQYTTLNVAGMRLETFATSVCAHYMSHIFVCSFVLTIISLIAFLLTVDLRVCRFVISCCALC